MIRVHKNVFLESKTGENKRNCRKEIIKMFMQIRKFQTDKNEFGQYVISIKNGKTP